MSIKKRAGSSRAPVYTLAFIIIALMSIVYKMFLSGTFDGFAGNLEETYPVTIESAERIESSEMTMYETTYETTCRFISVYICGEVLNPGVYEASAGVIVNDIVNMAGGFTEDAATERIDLVYIIDSNISIYIPGKDEAYDDGALIRSDGQIIWSAGTPGTTIQSRSDGLININSASKTELMTLQGIGEATADAIISYREDNGGFAAIEDIMNVSGIGPAKFNNIKDSICV